MEPSSCHAKFGVVGSLNQPAPVLPAAQQDGPDSFAIQSYSEEALTKGPEVSCLWRMKRLKLLPRACRRKPRTGSWTVLV